MPALLSPKLTEICSRHGINVDEQHSNADLIVLKDVPTNAAIFTKPRTNLCAARDRDRGFAVWVDKDLSCISARAPQAKLLSGNTHANWQMVNLPRSFASMEESVQAMVDFLSGVLPASDEPTRLDLQAPLMGKLLPAVGMTLELFGEPRNLIGRERELDKAERFAASGGKTTVFAGRSGSGLTSCATEVLDRLVSDQRARVIRIDSALIGTEMVYPASTDERWRQVLAECQLYRRSETWFLFDNIQWALRGGSLAQAAFATALERGLRCVCTCQTDVFNASRLLPMLARRLHWIELLPLEPEDLTEALRQRADILNEDLGVQIEPEAISAAIHQAERLPGDDPARVLQILESAAALADREGRVGPDEVTIAIQSAVPDA